MAERKSGGSVKERAAGGVMTESRPAPATPGPGHRRLDAFVGTWMVTGEAFDSPFGSAAPVTALETYEWLTGRFFLMHHLEGRLGDDSMACIEIIGHDAAGQRYPMRTFYNDGRYNEWQAQEHNGGWIVTGEWPVAGKRFKIRCTTVFGDAGASRTAKWEYSSDGAKWQTFWDVKATKAK
jgi:hypothetical protein